MTPEMCFNDGKEATENPKAPDASLEVDIFSLGVIFGQALSIGNQHPYGTGNLRNYRIQTKEPMMLSVFDFKGNERLFNLIHWMLNPEPKERPTVAQVLQRLEEPTFTRWIKFTHQGWASSRRGYDEIISQLNKLATDENYDVNKRDENGRTLLMLLCQKNQTESLFHAVEILLKQENVDVNAKDENGNNALTLLCENYNHDNLIAIVRLLIDTN